MYQSYHLDLKTKNEKLVVILHKMYKLLRSFLFLFDPERVHYFSMNALRIICSFSVGKKLISRLFSTPGVITNAATHKSYRHFNLNFKNPVGLGAGFDKNASEKSNELYELDDVYVGIIHIRWRCD